jgi:hypothetical protein
MSTGNRHRRNRHRAPFHVPNRLRQVFFPRPESGGFRSGFPLRGRSAQALHSAHGFLNFQASANHSPRLSRFMPIHAMNPASRPTQFPPRCESVSFRSGSRSPFPSARLHETAALPPPRFELATQPEKPSVPLALHSGPFMLRGKQSRPPRAPRSPHCPALSPRLAGFGFPLRLRRQTRQDLAPPLRLP